MNKKNWIYDLETLDIFTASFLDVNSDELVSFIISKDKDQRKELFEFLENRVSGLIGYNCLTFDSQILEYLYRNPNCTAWDIRNYANYITSGEDKRVDVPEWKLKIPHLDLYKINHFDNKNRRTGLKWCEYQMDLENIEDMPSQGKGSNWEEMVLSYNINDVLATKELYIRTIPMIRLRQELTNLYKINLMNASNSKIGSEILLKLYCNKTKKFSSDVRSMRTYRKEIILKDIIFNYIKFESNEFNYLLKELKSKIVTNTKEGLEYSIKYKGFQFDYGSGGIHGSISNKVIISDENNIIIDADVSSLYPSIAVVNRMYPRHLGPEFYNVYKEEIVDKRLHEKKKKSKGEEYNSSIIDGFKESANSAYGKSNDQYSWMYDPEYTMKTTVNGQLMLTMLAESLMNIEGLQLIQINTDGLTVRIPKIKLAEYYNKCEDWMSLTRLELEYAEYSKMVIIDVNNYLAFYTNGKYKAKGRLEFENIPLHKNKSYNIIPIAFYNYFKNNTSIEETIYNHKNIYDFCAGVKAKKAEKSGMSWFEIHSLDKGELKKQKLSKTVRYYISNSGGYLYKIYEDGSSSQVEAPKKIGKYIKDWKATYFNKYVKKPMEEYNLDFSFYISKTRELVDLFNNKQLNLF